MSQVRNELKNTTLLLHNTAIVAQNTAVQAESAPLLQMPQELVMLISDSDLPTLPPNSLSTKNISLEILLEAIGEKTRQTETTAGLASIKANADRRAAANAEKLKKIQEQIDKLESQGFWGKLSKAFSWIGAVAAIVVSATLVATGVGALAVAGLVVACVSLANQVLDTVGESVSGQGWGLTSWMAKGCGAIFGKNSEQWFKLGFDIALAITSIALSCGASSAATVADKASKITSITSRVATSIQTSSQIMSSGANIASSVYSYQASDAQADQKKLQAILEQINQMNELITKHLEKTMEEGQKLTETVTEIVKEQNATISAIVANVGGTAGTA